MEQARILIVDDEPTIVHMITMVLKKEGFTNIFTAHSGKEAMEIVNRETLDFILLDVMLPDESGFSLCPKIREKTDAFILFVTAKVSDLDRLTGFALGADDYITKPFNPLEIVARIHAKRRRYTNNEQPKQEVSRYDYGYFQLDDMAGEVTVNGEVIPFPAQVYHLLLHFCKHPNQVFSKEQLLQTVWGFQDVSDDNTVVVHIRRLRERIERDPSEPEFLITVRGLGYKLVKG